MADLTSIAKVRRYLFGNESTLDADEVLADLITSSSAWVERQIGRSFGSRTVTETRNGDGTTRMLLNDGPATAVTSVTVDGATIPKRADVSGPGWVLSGSAVDLVGYEFEEGIQNVVFVYSAGETVPADLEQAVIRHVAIQFHDRNHTGLGSTSGDGGSATYSNAGDLAFIRGVIESYQELAFA